MRTVSNVSVLFPWNQSKHSFSMRRGLIRHYSAMISGDVSIDDASDWHKNIGYPFMCLDPYAERNFVFEGNKYLSKAFIHFDRQQFEDRINALFHDQSNDIELKDGYAPFCKHLFVPNEFGVKNQMLRINEDNIKYLKSDYVARREEELPVLVRWFDLKKYEKELQPLITEATHLDIILYSRKQIEKENEAMKAKNTQKSPWGIISVKPQMIDYEIPMEPSTMMRNALPLSEGGSGVGLKHSEYKKSVEFWRHHARIQ